MLVVIEGGNVQEVLSDCRGLEVAVIDHDVQDDDEPDVVRHGRERYRLFGLEPALAPATIRRCFGRLARRPG